MTETSFKDHFSGVSAQYAAFRPTYPVALVDFLATIPSGRELALDCACGTGQLTVLLADRFSQVVGTDASAAQIQAAQPHERVCYRVALAEESGLPNASVDLLTVAQAAHWLDLEKFYHEVRRVARPKAGVALVSYGQQRNDGPIDQIVQCFYNETLGPFLPPERRHVEDGYRSLPFPFEELPFPVLSMEAFWRLDEFLGYLGTWSAVQTAEKTTGVNPVRGLGEQLQSAWGGVEAKQRITWPIVVRAGIVE
jgi:SAM-dependent methyltransferase